MAAAPIGRIARVNVSRYLRDIHRFPVLSLEEEIGLARRWHGDVTAHLGLVAKIAIASTVCQWRS